MASEHEVSATLSTAAAAGSRGNSTSIGLSGPIIALVAAMPLIGVAVAAYIAMWPRLQGVRGEGADVARAGLIHSVFTKFDEDCDGRLKEQELRRFAEETGWSGTDEEWADMYHDLCDDPQTGLRAGSPEDGFTEVQFAGLVDVQDALPVSNDALELLLGPPSGPPLEVASDPTSQLHSGVGEYSVGDNVLVLYSDIAEQPGTVEDVCKEDVYTSQGRVPAGTVKIRKANGRIMYIQPSSFGTKLKRGE